MLKLEREDQTSTVTLKFREREKVFHPLFLQALAIALAIHFAFFVFFHIAPFSLISSFTFPPVAVESSLPHHHALTISTGYLEIEQDILSPPLSAVMPLDWIALPTNEFLMPSIEYDVDKMQPLEAADWPLMYAPLPLSLDEPVIHLTISGELAQRKLLSQDPILEERRPFTTKPQYLFIDYHVQIDEQTGKVFWIEQFRSSGIKHVDKKIEQLVKRLEFEVDGTFKDTIGNLHFSILVEENDG